VFNKEFTAYTYNFAFRNRSRYITSRAHGSAPT